MADAYLGSSYSVCKVSMYPRPVFNKVSWLIGLYHVVQSNREHHPIRHLDEIPHPLKECNTENLRNERQTCENFHQTLFSHKAKHLVSFFFASLQNNKKISQAVGNRLSLWPK